MLRKYLKLWIKIFCTKWIQTNCRIRILVITGTGIRREKKKSSIPIHKAFFPHKIKLVLPCLALYPSLLALSGRVERGHLCTLVSWRYCQHLHQSYHYYLGSDVELEPVGPKLLYYIGNQSRDHKIVIGAVESFFYFVSTQKINSYQKRAA